MSPPNMREAGRPTPPPGSQNDSGKPISKTTRHNHGNAPLVLDACVRVDRVVPCPQPQPQPQPRPSPERSGESAPPSLSAFLAALDRLELEQPPSGDVDLAGPLEDPLVSLVAAYVHDLVAANPALQQVLAARLAAEQPGSDGVRTLAVTDLVTELAITATRGAAPWTAVPS